MKSNKKLVIGLSIFSSVLLIAVISLVAVLAAFQAQATGGFTVSYTAVNVDASVWCYMKKSSDGNFTGVNVASGNGNELRFTSGTADDGVANKKSFATVDNLVFDYIVKDIEGGKKVREPNPYIIKYHIQTYGTNEVNLTGGVDSVPDNLTIEYYLNSAGNDGLSNVTWTKVNDSTVKIVDEETITAKGAKFIYIRMYPTNLNESVSNTTINFNFTLTVA